MRRIVFGFVIAAAALTLPGPSSAADIPVKAPVPAAVVAAPVYNWTGFYVGGHIGYAWTDSATNITAANAAAVTFITGRDIATHLPLDPDGFVGGLQAGYNWQFSPQWLLGIEVDISFADLSATTALPGPADASRIMTARGDLNWLGTVRGRVGYLLTPDLMIFGAGGFAFGDADLSTALTRTTGAQCVGGANNCQRGAVSETLTGWTAGAGVEWAFARSWSAKIEYLYFDLGSISHLMTDPFFPAIFRAETDFTGHVLRVGLNYRFGAPVAARY